MSSAASDLGAPPLHTAPLEQWGGVCALRVGVIEARDLHRAVASPPVPYVLVTVVADGVAVPMPDATAELTAPAATHRPRFRWQHDWPVSVDPSLLRSLSCAVVHFVVLDDAARDPRAPPLGRAEVPLSPLLAGPAHSLDTTLTLLQPRAGGGNADVGSIDIALRWVRDPTSVGGFGALRPAITA